jgi:hypothetical protein
MSAQSAPDELAASTMSPFAKIGMSGYFSK